MTENEKRNLFTGVLGTISFLMFLLCILLILKLDKVKTVHKEKLYIEILQEPVPVTVEEKLEELKPEINEEKFIDDPDLKNYAVNKANKFDEEISTEKYEQQVMEELGMLKDESIEMEEGFGDVELNNNQDTEEPEDKSPTQYQGKTRIEYYLENRNHRFLYRPIYKCKMGGTVTIEITVSQKGEVSNAQLKEANTSEYCVIQTALDAAKKSRFNTDYKAPLRQKGSITYIFTAQ